MSRPRERDEQEALKLDEYFKQTLIRIRPYILALTAPEDVQLCKLWLNKLNGASTQRSLRNQYMVELCQYLKSGHVEGIFGKAPPNGPLTPLSKSHNLMNVSSSLSELSNISATPYQNWLKSNGKTVNRQFSRCKIPSKWHETDSTSTSYCVHGTKVLPNARFCEEGRLSKNRAKAYEQRIKSLTTIIKELQIQNERLNHELMQCQESCNVSETPQLQVNIKHLTTEVASLKAKLMEVQNMKETLETSHKETVQQYKRLMTEQFTKLKLRLQEAQCKNVTLNNNMATVTHKLEQIAREKEEEANIAEKEWIYKLDMMQQQYEAILQEKEKELQMKDRDINQKDLAQREEIESLIDKIRDLENKLEIKIDDESKLQATLTEQYALMKEEFNKMRNDMELATRKQNESLVNKITAMKKSILKLEKSKEKLGHEYEKKIFHILKNKELIIRALQLQLQGQRSELSTSLSSEKQCELDNLVGTLEERYKALLAAVDATADNQRQTYLRKITVLEAQLVHLKKSLVDSDT